VIDYDYIEAEIEGLSSDYDIREIGYDPWGALQLAQHLEAKGFEMVEVRQGTKSMSEPTKEMLRLVLGGKLRHGDNPVLTWMADNAVVTIDSAENVKPDKKKSTERIDGIVAAIMALGRLTLHAAPIAKVEVWAV
ncbi:MAG TPA: terminase TerL endonuclease subunit, partial [Candidatus Heimdallarchaeota archaeon]|nr:terminase TerL endonuclease subunit [Candidatus Heimdallarchaeota archaeon]